MVSELGERRLPFSELASLSARLREARERAGKTQAEIANDLGIKQSTVGRWETAKAEPPLAYIEYATRIFDCTAGYLLKGTTDTPTRAISQQATVGSACISLPADNQRSLSQKEKKTLEKALRVMRAPQARGTPCEMLLKSIDTVYDNVTMRAELEGSGGQLHGEGSGASSAKRRRTR